MTAANRHSLLLLATLAGAFPQLMEARALGQGISFQPTIGTAFDGAYMDVVPVVSADRRSVRVGVSAAFSTINGFTNYSVPVVAGGLGGAPAGGGARSVGVGGIGGVFLNGPTAGAYGYASVVTPGYQPLAGAYYPNAQPVAGDQPNFGLARNMTNSDWPAVAPDQIENGGVIEPRRLAGSGAAARAVRARPKATTARSTRKNPGRGARAVTATK